MGRASLIVNESELQSVIDGLESSRVFSRISDLCDEVALTEWARNVKNTRMKVRGLSPQMVYIKIKEFKLPIKTRPGKRGKVTGQVVNKRTRKEKLSEIPGMTTFSTALTKSVKPANIPDKYKRMASLAILGNVRACIGLMCGQCMGYSGAEKACDGALGGTPCAIYPQNRLIYSSRRTFVEGDDGFFETEREKTL